MDQAIQATVGAAAGAVFTELLRTVREFKNKTVYFKSSLVHLQYTLETISSVIKEMEQLNNELRLPKEELQSLIRKMEEGTQLVSKCSKIQWLNFVSRACYKDKLDRFSDELVKIFAINMQAQMARDQKETLLEVRRILMDVEKQRFDPREAIDKTLSMFLTWISVFAVMLISVISALRWIFPSLIRVAFTSSSTEREQFALDKQLKRKKEYFLSARSLTIFWGDGDTPRFWEWTVPGVRYSEEVAEIVSVSWLKILGRIKTGKLSPNTLYGAYLAFKVSSDGAYGFTDIPIVVSIGVMGKVTDSRIVNLVVGRWRKLGHGVQYPKESDDGWMELEMGDFFNGSAENKEVEIGLYDTEKHYDGRKAGGIVVQGIKIRPKYES